MSNQGLPKNIQLWLWLFIFIFIVSCFDNCNAQDANDAMDDSFNSNSQPSAPPGPQAYLPGHIQTDDDGEPRRPSTPDGTEDASRASAEFAQTLPNNPRGLVRVIKGLLTERHPNVPPNDWQKKYWLGRCFVAFDRLTIFEYPCYLAWYQVYLVSINMVWGGNQTNLAEFNKRWIIAEKICDQLSGKTSTEKFPTPFLAANKKSPASPLPDYYNSNSPSAAPPPAAPQTAQAEAKNMPPVAPQRNEASLPPTAADNTFSAREPDGLPGSESEPPNGPFVIQGEAGKHFATAGQALKSWASSVWPESKKQAVEYAGKLYQNWKGTWSYTPSYRGAENNSDPEKGSPYVFTHGNPFKSYDIHTHGDYRAKVTKPDGTTYYRQLEPNERRSVDEFSKKDRFRSYRSGQPQFMLTPGGVLLEFIPDCTAHLGFAFGLTGQDTYGRVGDLSSNEWHEPNNL